MSRTAEKVLSIIAAAFTGIGIIFSFLGLSFLNFFKNDPTIRMDMEMEFLSDPTMTGADIDLIFQLFDFLAGFSWVIIIGLIFSLVLTIVGISGIWNNKNPKLAGTMFIIGGLLAGILSLSSILLYIAGILCFTRKPQLTDDELVFEDNNYDGTMRPL